MPERLVFLAITCVLLSGGTFLGGQESPASPEERETLWYRSNSAGMTLEFVPSRIAALRNQYCLSIETPEPGGIPEILLPHYEASFAVELRTLYENAAELRRQWLFRDEKGTTRLTASGSGALFGAAPAPRAAETGTEETPVAETRTGFIEIRNGDGALTREFRFEEDLSEWDFRFNYRGNTLISAETLFKAPPAPAVSGEDSSNGADENSLSATPPVMAPLSAATPAEAGPVPVSTDYYRYSRSGSLRAIDREIHGGAAARHGFPRIGTDFGGADELVNYGIAYTSEFLQDITSPEGSMVSYSLDNRGRVLSETWKDEEEKTIGEFTNTWSGDRLVSIHWKSEDDERLVEYEYDSAGNRLTERNYKSGELERSVRNIGGQDMEEIYKDGKLMLRAIWENGRKISEEWITGGGTQR